MRALAAVEPDRSWVRRAAPAALSGGCLALIAAIGLRADRLPLQMLLAGLLGLIFAVLALRSMEAGLTLLVAAGGLVSFSIGTGTMSSINVAMVLVGLLTGLLAIRMAARRSFRLAASELNLPWLAFLASAAVSWIASALAVGPLVELPANIGKVQAGQFAVYALTACAFWLGANHRVSERTLGGWTLFLVGIGTLVYAWDSAAGWRHALGHWTGSLYLWPVVMAAAHLLFNERLRRPWRLAGTAVAVLWAVWVVRAGIGFKGGWVPALLALLLLLLLRSWRYLAVGVLILGLVVVFAGPDRIVPALLAEEESSASPVRPALWVDVFRMGLRSPVWGLGLATYSYYWREPTFESVSYRYVSPSAFSRENYAPPAHNMYADVFAQMGSIGLVLLLVLLAAALRLGLSAWRTACGGIQKAHAAAIFSGLASLAVSSFLFADWLLPYVYNVGLKGFPQTAYSWLLLGTLVPIAGLARQKAGAA